MSTSTSTPTPTIRFDCPSCGTTYRVPQESVGRKARCTNCGATFQAPPSVKSMLSSTMRHSTASPASLPAPDEQPQAEQLSPSGSDSHAADAPAPAQAEASSSPGSSRRPEVIEPTKRQQAKPAATKKKRARKWNVLAVLGALLLLASTALPWLHTEMPPGSLFGVPTSGVSPLRLAIDPGVIEDAGAINPGGGTPILLRLVSLLLPLLALALLFREWSTRRQGAHPQTTLAVTAIGSVIAVALMFFVVSSHGWEIAAEESLAASLDLAGGLTGNVAVLRAHLALGALVWFLGSVLTLLAVLKARKS